MHCAVDFSMLAGDLFIKKIARTIVAAIIAKVISCLFFNFINEYRKNYFKRFG
jgi:hypothetical protein